MLLLYAALGGMAGTLLRYSVGGWLFERTGGHFPWGTLAVNAVGCFVLGAVMHIAQQRGLSPGARVFLTVGFCGGLTTFSSYIYELNLLNERDSLMRAALYGFGSLAVGFAALLLGMAASGALLRFGWE